MKRQILLTMMFLGTAVLQAQTTPVPDPAFEAELISQGIDTNGMNGNILNTDAAGVTNLNVNNSGISNLAGIEAFVDLVMLDCEDNMLSSLDLSFNSMLTILDCNNNTISNLNINGNADLVSLNASDNELTSINLANNLAISDITLQNNQLTDLDLTNNSNLYQIVAHDNDLVNISFPPAPTLLEIVWVYNNDLLSIDLTTAPILATLRFENNDLTFLDLRNGNNMNINTMDARDNPNLQFICVDDVAYASNATNWNKDSTAQYSEDCALGTTEFDLTTVYAYPNPTGDIIRLESNGLLIESLELISTNGIRMSLDMSDRLDLSHLSAGFYLLKVRLEDGRLKTIRIVKR